MLNNSVTKQVFWFSLSSYLGVVIGVISTLFIYPNNPEFLGIIRTVESYSQIIFPIILIGASQALVHFYPTLTPENKNRLFLYSLYSVVVNSVLLLGCVALLFSVFDFEYQNLVWIAFPIGFSIALNEVFKRQSLNLQKIAYPTFFEKIIPKVTLPLIFILLAWQYISDKRGLWLFAVSYFLITLLTGIYTVRKDKTQWDSRFRTIFNSISKKEYFRYSLYAFTGSLGSLLAFRIDTLMLGYLGYSMSEIGIYNLGAMVAATLIIPATGIFAINSPVISELVKENRLQKLSVKYKENAKLLFAIGALLYCSMLLGIYDLFSLLPAKDNLLQSIPVLLVLGLGVVVNMGTGFNSEIITYSKYYRFNVIAILVMIGLNISLNLFFVRGLDLGAIGVAYATLVSLTCFNVLKLVYIQQKMGINPFDKKYLFLLLIVLSITWLVYLLPNLESHLWNLIYKSGLAFVLNLALIYKLKLVYQLNNFKKFR